MKHRRTHEQLKQTVLKTEADTKNMTVKKACAKNKIKPQQFYEKRKEFVGTTRMVNNVEQKVKNLKTSFEDAVIDRVAEKIIARLARG